MNDSPLYRTTVQSASFQSTEDSKRTILAHDPDALARSLTNWNQCYDQMSCDRFEGGLVESRVGRLQVFRESISQAVYQTCRVWPDAIWFGFPQHESATRINGRPAAPATVLLQQGDSEFELVTPSAYTIYGIVVPRDLLIDVSCRLQVELDWDALGNAEMLSLDNPQRAAFLDMLAAQLGLQAGEQQSQDALVSALVSLLDHGQPDAAVTRSLKRRQQVIDKVRDYVLANRDQPVSIPDLCAHTHTSRRTLQYCFEDILGVSPVNYLRILRLNGARRELLGAGNARRQIGEVASAWGYGTFSQFSCDYRKLFGEPASATLRKTATCAAC